MSAGESLLSIPLMRPLITCLLLALPIALIGNSSHAQSRSSNPYQQQLNEWNNSFPGYKEGGREIRQQIREMNPWNAPSNEFRNNNPSLRNY